MIHIERGQPLATDANLKVATATGDYEDAALIECYNVADPEVLIGAYQAQYVKYGDLVYRFNDPVELGKAILTTDPQASHSAASYVRMTEELLAKMNTGALEPESLDQVIATEQAATEELRTEPQQDQEVAEEATAPVQEEQPVAPATTPAAISTDVSSTTPNVLGASTEATSTPAASGVIDNAATSTPIMPEIIIPEATSTPEALRKGGKKIAKVMRRSRG
ncbi:MAG: hypothetical protein KBD50_00895 [Candidatus Pacebacteria bacterium]|nr:hypothetical protein [Candidatus Paceibacterota bacterium]